MFKWRENDLNSFHYCIDPSTDFWFTSCWSRSSWWNNNSCCCFLVCWKWPQLMKDFSIDISSFSFSLFFVSNMTHPFLISLLLHFPRRQKTSLSIHQFFRLVRNWRLKRIKINTNKFFSNYPLDVLFASSFTFVKKFTLTTDSIQIRRLGAVSFFRNSEENHHGTWFENGPYTQWIRFNVRLKRLLWWSL